ncbi:MAG: zinc-binding alcohol dehydrogenase [Variibacter sp.]
MASDLLADTAQALWYVAPGRAEMRTEALASPAPKHVRVRTLYSALSRGTETTVASGHVPPSEFERMRAPFMDGHFPFPVKYGYAVVGEIVADAGDTAKRRVFALYPHQTEFNIPAAAVCLVPDAVPSRRAVLAANMETALNAVWDGAPGPADRIAIIGGGVVGALLAYLCGRIPGADVTLVDVKPARRELARTLGVGFAAPEAARENCDLVFHASGTGEGLQTSLRLAGEESKVVEVSWYGETKVTAALGGAFHSRRLQLISSQVGTVAPSRRPRWSHARRLAAALALLADPRLDSLLEPDIPFHDLPHRLPQILDPKRGTLCQVISYP